MPNPSANLGSATYFAFTQSGGAAVTDVSQYHSAVRPSYAAPRVDTTTFGNTTRNSISGYIENGYVVEGVWDTTIDGYYMAVLGGTAAAVVYGPGGSVSAKAKHSSSATCISYSPPADKDNAVTFTAEWAVNGAVTRTTF